MWSLLKQRASLAARRASSSLVRRWGAVDLARERSHQSLICPDSEQWNLARDFLASGLYLSVSFLPTVLSGSVLKVPPQSAAARRVLDVRDTALLGLREI